MPKGKGGKKNKKKPQKKNALYIKKLCFININNIKYLKNKGIKKSDVTLKSVKGQSPQSGTTPQSSTTPQSATTPHSPLYYTI